MITFTDGTPLKYDDIEPQSPLPFYFSANALQTNWYKRNVTLS